MIAPTGMAPDTSFGGANIEPLDRGDYQVYQPIKLAPFKLRWSTMRLEYMNKWYQHHRDVSRFVNPKRGFFEGYVPNWNAQIDHRLIITGKPRRNVRTMAAGMQSGLSSPARPWWVFGLPDKELEKFGPVKEWLEYSRDLLLRIFARSNVYQATHQNYEELGIFGTGSFGIYEDFKTVLRARSYTCGEYYLANDESGRVNAFARQYWKTADQIINKHGWKNCSDKVQRAYKAGQRDTFFLLYEILEQNTTKVEGRYDFTGKSFRQVTFEADGSPDKALEIGGYNEFPVIAARWDTVTTADTYGIGPALYALGDVKSIYKLKKDMLLGVNKLVDPPVVVNSTVQGQANMNPGGITRSSSQTTNPGAQPAYQVNPDLKDGLEFLAQFYRDLDEEFYTDLFSSMLSLPDDSKRTAAEIAARHEEKLLLLGPVLERVFFEMFDPMIDRSFAIAMRAGLIPPPPPEIMGMEMTPRYISLLAQAQQMAANTANEKGLAYMGNMQAINPQALDVVNFDEMAREELSGLGVSERVLRSPDEVAGIRQQRQQEQAQIKAQQDAMAATVAAKNLSQTPVGDRSALEHLAGAQPSPTGGNA